MEGELDPLLHQAVRGRIMAYLFRNRHASFAQLRRALDLTQGNLQSHALKLEAAGYVRAEHLFAGRFELRYSITDEGARAFRAYVEQLRALIDDAGV